MFHGTDSQLAEATGVPQRTSIDAKNRVLRKKMRKQRLGRKNQNPLLSKDCIDIHLAIPKEAEQAHLTPKEREAVFEFLMQHREEYVKTLGEVDKENRGLCTAANQVYNVAFQAEIAQFIGETWVVQLGNMTTHDGLKKIIKLLRDNFLLEDDADQLIDKYVPDDPEEEEEEGEIRKSPDQALSPLDFKIQEEIDDDVVITGEVQAGKGKQAVEEPAMTGGDYWKDAEAYLDGQFAEIERKQKEAQLDADFQEVTEQLAKDAAGGTRKVGIDDFPVYTLVVGPPMAPLDQEAHGETEQTVQAEQLREQEQKIREEISEATPEQGEEHEHELAQPP